MCTGRVAGTTPLTATTATPMRIAVATNAQLGSTAYKKPASTGPVMIAPCHIVALIATTCVNVVGVDTSAGSERMAGATKAPAAPKTINKAKIRFTRGRVDTASAATTMPATH